ncbi:hypothetical protein BLS_002944 [Venturia inaequalis]|uniref:RRM domain-containing protein n=1 Tax=Venturia inaequalis TaxID=5025 RepID=A0A8H3UQG0_VENIN|nr:hypothetical protein BLS_002944 [Venturia inaequalis]
METAISRQRTSFRVWRKSDQADEALESFEWDPPKDSDDLFEALKTAYPKGKTHRSRMRKALIEFLIQECETDRDETQPNPSPRSHTSSECTPGELESRQDNEDSILPAAAMAKSSVLTSSAVAKVPRRRRSPKDWDDMTVVWTAKDGLLRNTGPKRTMTEQEKAEYQLRRAQGASVICRRKTRKCTHNVLKPDDRGTEEKECSIVSNTSLMTEGSKTSQIASDSLPAPDPDELSRVTGRVKNPTSRPLASILKPVAFGVSPTSPSTDLACLAQIDDVQTWHTELIDDDYLSKSRLDRHIFEFEQNWSRSTHDEPPGSHIPGGEGVSPLLHTGNKNGWDLAFCSDSDASKIDIASPQSDYNSMQSSRNVGELSHLQAIASQEMHSNSWWPWYDLPLVETTCSSHPNSYGLPQLGGRSPVSLHPILDDGMMFPDAAVPASLDSACVSPTAKYGPVTASVPSQSTLNPTLEENHIPQIWSPEELFMPHEKIKCCSQGTHKSHDPTPPPMSYLLPSIPGQPGKGIVSQQMQRTRVSSDARDTLEPARPLPQPEGTQIAHTPSPSQHGNILGLRSRSIAAGAKLFVGGLSLDASDEKLRVKFEEFGTVEEARVVKDRETGRSRGFGFVRYTLPESADTAISKMNDVEFDGRTLHVHYTGNHGRAGERGGFSGRGWGGGSFGRGVGVSQSGQHSLWSGHMPQPSQFQVQAMPYSPNDNAAIPTLQDKRQGGYGSDGHHRKDQGKPEGEKLWSKESPTSGVDVLTLAIGKLKVEDRR